jgi:glycosyltransferase involved in cell wall biosynthesis
VKFVIASSFVPFIKGGARYIVEWLAAELSARGHEVEHLFLPFVDDPEHMLEQICAYRLMDLSQSCDRLICIRPPAYVIRHPFKIVWFIHHFRVFYDLWDSPVCDIDHSPHNIALRKALMRLDTNVLREARQIYALSETVAARLRQFNGIDAPVLYQPLRHPDLFANDGYGDEIVFVCRMEAHKRQHLLIEAMRHVKTAVRLRLCGASSEPPYALSLEKLVKRHRLQGKVMLESGWISEARKIELIGGALAVANVALDEDGFAYVSLEAAYAEKAIITTTDAGGVLELVKDGVNGVVAPPDPVALAAVMDRLYAERSLAQALGRANRGRVSDLKIGWDGVIQAMTG